jgi:DNA modification methylase
MRKLIADGIKVQTCVTSPPYFGLRDYGTATWEGGNADCDHSGSRLKTRFDYILSNKQKSSKGTDVKTYDTSCPDCGAKRIDRQLGLEATPAEFVANMVEVFDLVRELLADNGTLWLNLGDSYAANRGYQVPSTLMNGDMTNKAQAGDGHGMKAASLGFKPKDLMGMPWRVAFALQDAGWYLRQDIIWAKPNPMPESVTDRCTKSHEYLFLLSKSERYFYDNEAIKEPCTQDEMANGFRGGAYCNNSTFDNIQGGKRTSTGNHRVPAGWDQSKGEGGHGSFHKDGREKAPCRFGGNKYGDDSSESTRTKSGNWWQDKTGKRNKRSVWTIATEAYSEAHFATFPTALVEPCILAGAPVGGIVFDPFLGSGTTAQVAQTLGRQWIGCELNPDYFALQDKRTRQNGLALEFA